jgi:hypothetical protein
MNIKDVELIDNTIFLIGSDFFQLSLEGKILRKGKQGGRKIVKGFDNSVFYLLDDKVIELKNNKEKEVKLLNPMLKPICLKFENDSCFWLGTNNGLYKYKNDSIEDMGFLYSRLNEFISDIAFGQTKKYFAIRGYGLGVLSKDTFVIINTSNGLSSNFINSIQLENDSTIWLGTNTGLNKLSYKGKKYSISTFTTQEGLPSNNIKKIGFYNNNLWLATSNGLANLVNTAALLKKSKSYTFLDSVLLNNQREQNSQYFNLDENEQKLEFFFKCIDFNEGSKDRLFFSINGGNKFSFVDNYYKTPNLKSGYYRISFFNFNQNIYSEFYTVTINIKESFIKSIYFQITILILIFAFIIVSTRYTIAFVKSKALSKEQYLKNKQKALITQISPSFFYMVIETMRYLLSKGRTLEVNDYLNNFTELLKSILFNSSFNIIAIEKEIEIIRYYLGMSKVRYKNNLEIEIVIENEFLLKNVYIPPMLALGVVDAFIENVNPIYLNKIKILVEEQNKYCFFSIQFSVYGQKEISSFLSEERRVFIAQRVSLANKLYNSTIKFDFELIEDRANHFVGENRNFLLPFERDTKQNNAGNNLIDLFI